MKTRICSTWFSVRSSASSMISSTRSPYSSAFARRFSLKTTRHGSFTVTCENPMTHPSPSVLFPHPTRVDDNRRQSARTVRRPGRAESMVVLDSMWLFFICLMSSPSGHLSSTYCVCPAVCLAVCLSVFLSPSSLSPLLHILHTAQPPEEGALLDEDRADDDHTLQDVLHLARYSLEVEPPIRLVPPITTAAMASSSQVAPASAFPWV